MTNTLESLQEELGICEQDLRDANKAKARLKKGSAKAKYYKGQFEDAVEQKEAAEYNAYIYKLVADAATKGVEINSVKRTVAITDVENFMKLDQGLRGVSQDAEGNNISKEEFMQQNILDICALGKPKSNYPDVSFPHATSKMLVLGHKDMDLEEFCLKHKDKLAGSQIIELPQQDYDYFTRSLAPSESLVNDHVSEVGQTPVDQIVEG